MSATPPDRTDQHLHAMGVALFDRWTALWNGELATAHAIMASDFTLRYAQPEPMDTVRTPDQLAALIAQWRRLRHDPLFRADGQAIVAAGADPRSGIVVRPYSSTFTMPGAPPRTVGGIDWLRFADGRIVEVLSASGGRDGRSFRLAPPPAG